MTPAQRRINRSVLALEVALGVLPITIVGGVYGLMGALFGTVSLIVSAEHLSLSAFGWWLAVFALALGGLSGIVGLWLLVLIEVKDADRRLRIAFVLSTIGVVTAIVALTLALAERAVTAPQGAIVYLLVSPIVVVCHHAYARRADLAALFSGARITGV